jgi:hypothetical protein
MLNDERANMEH